MNCSGDAATVQVQEQLKALYPLVHDIEKKRVRSELNLTNITKVEEKLNEDKRVTTYYQQKLKTLYMSAIADATREEELIRKALKNVYNIQKIRKQRRVQAHKAGEEGTIGQGELMKMLQNSAQTLPLWVGKEGEKTPPLCGATPADPNYIAKTGDMVAALVKGGEEEDNWILAEVVNFNSTTNKYEVDDIDEAPRAHHIGLRRRYVVPLPLMRANPATDPHALFPEGSAVMGLYPQTTCFYKAVVNKRPSTAAEGYQLLFEDSSYLSGFSPPVTVAQQYVISIKDKKGNTQ